MKNISRKDMQLLLEITEIINKRQILMRSYNLKKLIEQNGIKINLRIVKQFILQNPLIGANKIVKYIYQDKLMAVLDFNGFQRAISLDFISQKFILKNFQDQTVLDSLVQILDDEPTTVKQVQRLSKQLYKLLYNRIFEYDIISHLDGDIKINIDNVIISISAQVASRNRYLMKTLLDLFFND